MTKAKTSKTSHLPSTDAQPNPPSTMAEIGRKGGLIGGKRSMEMLTQAERRERARTAARARWAKSQKP